VPYDRRRPRLWQFDYLHLRPLVLDLEQRLPDALRGARFRLDLGCGDSPYRDLLEGGGPRGWVIRVDAWAGPRPDVVARAEELPFMTGAFDAVLATQVLQSVEDPGRAAAEMGRVVSSGGRVWASTHGAWPHCSPVPEHRFGEPDLRALFAGLHVREVVPEAGLLAHPFALLNIVVREATRAADRRLGALAWPARPLAAVVFLLSNLTGRLLERLAMRGPLAIFLGALDRSLPLNYLVVAEKP